MMEKSTPNMFTVASSTQSVLNSLDGSGMRIPPLEPMVGHWPMGISQHREKLEVDINNRIDDLCKDKNEQLASKLKTHDFALFASALWPQACYDRLRIMAFFSLWIFMWSDEIDDATGEFFERLSDADTLRMDTLRFAQCCLGLSEGKDECEPGSGIVRSFAGIGEAVCRVYSEGQRQRLLDEIAYFIQTSRQEQYARVKGQLLPLEEYNRLRIGTTAAPVLMAMNEYVTEVQLPQKLVESPRMKMLSDQTSLVGAYVNDILSVDREVAKGAPFSLIPVLYASHRDLEKATKEGADLLKQNIKSVDSTMDKIMTEAGAESEAAAALTKYCKHMCTGLLYWTLHSERYNLNAIPRDSDGSLRFHLVAPRRSPLVALGGSVMRAVGAIFHPPVLLPVAFVSIASLKRWQ